MELKTLLLMAFLSVPFAQAYADVRALDGHYYLQGAMEMDAELLLRKDGTFSAGIAYGSAEGITKGNWYVEDNTLMLEQEPAAQPAKKLSYKLSRERTLDELKKYADNEKNQLAKENYVLELRYDRQPPPPPLKPVIVNLEFDSGPPGQLLLSSNQQTDLWFPYDPKRTLKKIGFGTDHGQWFDVAPDSRAFNIGWKKRKNQPLTFEQPIGFDLATTRQYLTAEEQERVDHNYWLTLFHFDPVSPPAIEPVVVHWQFEDGSTQKQVWASSQQNKLRLPFSPKKTLAKIGLHTQNSPDDLEWLAVMPDTRWATLDWQAYPDPANGDLSVLFQDLQLAIEPNCLAVDFGNGKACFRRK
ncbi:hypothetical protein [Pseudomonas atagonensis]|uniref:hypothetical protein n=1 Tax=Pseudomonas atagonensis TaxID=2609964 RepID=UPI0014080B1F|nr:hypothetical protein [Pseudomonas atagonensis]